MLSVAHRLFGRFNKRCTGDICSFVAGSPLPRSQCWQLSMIYVEGFYMAVKTQGDNGVIVPVIVMIVFIISIVLLYH